MQKIRPPLPMMTVFNRFFPLIKKTEDKAKMKMKEMESDSWLERFFSFLMRGR